MNFLQILHKSSQGGSLTWRAIGKIIHGPFLEAETNLTVMEGNWNLESLSFTIPKDIKPIIIAYYRSNKGGYHSLEVSS
ncbi:hypothetical protein H5410_031849 [Solanum commersonii]|uniref:Uncharacterized protein n=1 Tax=Solanum commersonii TaxID=4109 RepID=A0A9J5YL60_SOLCO|nr:hypothetical protein H5410_031849 [Solanum commersonii]